MRAVSPGGCLNHTHGDEHAEVIGSQLSFHANDVVTPLARTDKSSRIYGMPILNADGAQNIIVIKRGKGAGSSGIENALFVEENSRLCRGSAQGAVSEMMGHIKALS